MIQETDSRKIPDNVRKGLHQLTEMNEKLILQAWSDPVFKQELIANPAGAVEKLFGIKVPAFLKLKVIEETPDIRYIVLPFQANPADRQLSDEQLERIAGGASRTAPQACEDLNNEADKNEGYCHS